MVPGPKYDTEVFSATEYNSKFFYIISAFNRAYSKKDRFKYKTFLNKTGPVFYKGKEDVNVKETKVDGNQMHQQTMSKEKKIPVIKQKENVGGKQGFSLGIRPAQVQYRKQRKEKMNELLESYKNIFDLENVTSLRVGSKRSQSNITNFTRATQKRKKTRDRKGNYRLTQAKEKREDLNKQRLDKIEELRVKQEESLKTHMEKTENYWKRKKQKSASKSKIVKEQVFPPFYNTTRGFEFDSNKKFTFGAKLVQKKNFFNESNPLERKQESDTDKIIKNPTIR